VRGRAVHVRFTVDGSSPPSSSRNRLLICRRACNEFIDAIGPKQPFMGGDKPNLADLAVYGVLKAVERTPTYEDALANSKIRPWVERTAAAIGNSARVSTEGSTWGLAPPGTPVTKSA
jgi:hypothetical protein